MPEWSILDQQRWVKRITDAETYQAEYHPRWKQSLELYDMSFWRKNGYSASLTDPITPVNYTTTFVSTMVAAIYSRNPKIFIKSRRPRYATFAQHMEDLTERYWDEENLKETLIEIVHDAEIFNIGWAEIGYLKSVEAQTPQETAAQTQPGALDAVFSSLLRMMGRSTEKQPVQQGVLDDRMETGSFYCLRRSAWDVFFPKGFRSYWSLPFLIVRERVLLEDFLNNPRYQHKEQVLTTKLPEPARTRLVGPGYPASLSGSALMQALEISDHSVIDLYTVWDRRSQQVFTISKGAHDPHVGPDPWPYLPAGFPLIPLQFNKVPDTPDTPNAYGFSDIEPITPQVIEKSNIRTQMVEHRRRAATVIFVQKNSTTETELRNHEQADALAIIPVTNIQAIQVSQPISVPPAAFETELAINSDLDRDSGLSLILADSQKMASIERASVAQIAQSNANLKTSYKVDRIEAFSRHLATYQCGLFWQFMTRQQVGEYLGTIPTEDAWPSLPQNLDEARKRVRKELDLRIEAGSTRPITDDVLDREQFLRYLTIFQQTAPLLYKKVEKPALALMAKKFREPALEALILQALDEQELEVAQAENALLEQNIPQIVSPHEDHELHLKVHGQGLMTPMKQAHGQAHMERMNEILAGQKSGGQGVRQSAQAPSAAETNRMGTPGLSDVSGQSMNLRAGTGQPPQPK